jgi:hypothetical protein
VSDEPTTDHLDGCELDFDDPETNTADDQVAALVLFADIDFTDPAAVTARKAEWETLWASA